MKLQWISLSKLARMKLNSDKHGNLLYWECRDGIVYHQGRKLRKADPDTFEVLSDPDSFVARDASHVFHGWSLVSTIDVRSFEPLGDFYYRDRHTAYGEFETSLRPLKGKESKKFAVIGAGYARDSSYAYWWGRPIRNCSFSLRLKLLKGKDGDLDYATDGESIYFEAAALKGADPDCWHALEGCYSKDGAAVYFCSRKLPRADPDTWQHLDNQYSRDATRVYHMDRNLKLADVEGWTMLNNMYSTDGKHCYWLSHLLDDADSRSFKVNAKGVASDKHGQFDRCQRK